MQYGMQTFDQHLASLVQSRDVTFEVALAAASRPSDFELNFRTLGHRMRDVPTVTSAPPAPVTAEAQTPVGMAGVSSGFDFLS